MWREIGIKFSMMVLPSVPAYHAWTSERLSMRLEHSFVPCLKAFKVSQKVFFILFYAISEWKNSFLGEFKLLKTPKAKKEGKEFRSFVYFICGKFQ